MEHRGTCVPHLKALRRKGYGATVEPWNKILKNFHEIYTYISLEQTSIYMHVLIYAVFFVPQFHTPPKKWLKALRRKDCGPWNLCSTHVPHVPHYSGNSSGSSSSSSSTVGSRRQKHSVGIPLIRFPLVLARPRVSIRDSCFSVYGSVYSGERLWKE